MVCIELSAKNYRLELVSMGKCSEMDIVLDLWVHTIYNNEQVQDSELGPVVYFRNCTGNPLTNFSDLALGWGISKATISRILNKLQDKEYRSLAGTATLSTYAAIYPPCSISVT